MSRAVLLTAVALLGLLAGAVADLAGASRSVTSLIVLGTALAIADQFALRPVQRAALPLSFAVVVVLVRAADPLPTLLTIVAAYALSMVLSPRGTGVRTRVVTCAERVVEGGAAVAAFALIGDAGGDDPQAAVLVGLTAAAVVQIAIADGFSYAKTRELAPIRARGADLALVSSAILMGVGYDGIGGEGSLGLWGPLLFSIPLLAAWYSFELVASTRRSFWQTVRALGRAPELAGLARPGHAQRVADLAVAMGSDLGLSTSEIDQLETAALLHHLGAVCLDAPTDDTPLDPSAVSRAGGEMLRGSEVLEGAGDIVAAEPMLHRPPGDVATAGGTLAGQILKVASAFDELTDGCDAHATWALEAIYTGPLYVYDGRVVGALERVLERRGVLAARV